MIDAVSGVPSTVAATSSRSRSLRERSTVTSETTTTRPSTTTASPIRAVADVAVSPSEPTTPSASTSTPTCASEDDHPRRRRKPNTTTPSTSSTPTGASNGASSLPSMAPTGSWIPSQSELTAAEPITTKTHPAQTPTSVPVTLAGSGRRRDPSEPIGRRWNQIEPARISAASANADATAPPLENAWTDAGIPERVTAIPTSTARAAMRRHSCAAASLRTCNEANSATSGASAVFSTGSQAHQPPQPNSSCAHHEPSSVAASRTAAAPAVQRRAASDPGRTMTNAAPNTAACAR